MADAEIVPFAARADRVDAETHRGIPDDGGPWLSGVAICGACGHEWAAVAKVGAQHLDCPKCGRAWGAFKNAVEPSESVWRCNCGEDLFWLTPKGAMCRRCGVISSDWAE